MGNFGLARPSNDGKPRIEMGDIAYGFRYAAIRIPTHNSETHRYVRQTLFVAPFHACVAAPAGIGFVQMFIPIDDECTMLHTVRYQFDESGSIDDARALGHKSGLVRDPGSMSMPSTASPGRARTTGSRIATQCVAGKVGRASPA